jgi:prepilin-type processing-associated H-X9-DG protein
MDSTFNTSWFDVPASYHDGAGALSFADGHSEVKVWKDPNIREKPVLKQSRTSFTRAAAAATSPNDLGWLQERTTVK